MASQSLKTYKGCAMCKPHKWKANGKATKTPFWALRKIGTKRRLTKYAAHTEY